MRHRRGPDPGRTVVAGRGDQAVVPAEAGVGDGLAMPGQNLERRAGERDEHSRRGVVGGGHDVGPGVAELDRVDRPRVADQRLGAVVGERVHVGQVSDVGVGQLGAVGAEAHSRGRTARERPHQPLSGPWVEDQRSAAGGGAR